MKNENFLVTVIRTEMPKVHCQTLIYREYQKSSQRKGALQKKSHSYLQNLAEPEELYWNRKTTPEMKLSNYTMG